MLDRRSLHHNWYLDRGKHLAPLGPSCLFDTLASREGRAHYWISKVRVRYFTGAALDPSPTRLLWLADYLSMVPCRALQDHGRHSAIAMGVRPGSDASDWGESERFGPALEGPTC